MVKPKFVMKVKQQPNPHNINKRRSKTHAKIARETINRKEDEMNAAVQWCKDNNKRGWAALKTGLFGTICDARAINRRLDGEVETSREYESRSIQTLHEEQILCSHIKNMNRCHQGLSRSHANEVVLQFLKIRKLVLSKYGKKRAVPLSRAAQATLESDEQ